MDNKYLGRALSRLSANPVPRGGRMCPSGVTIAIPNWNHEYLLSRSIGSALRAVKDLRGHQVPAEVLVIDDHSRDGSLTLLRQLEALYFNDGLRVLALTRNCGLPVVRNYALLNSTYRYIAFMDADNEIVPENLYHFYRAIIQTRAAVVYGNLIWEGRDPDDTSLISNESFQFRMFAKNYIDAFALVDRLQVLDAGGYLDNVEVRAYEDWELYLHLAASGRRIVFVPLVFGFYHAVPGSMIEEANDNDGAQPTYAYMRRVFDQLDVRGRLTLNTRHLRYHPDIGYL